MNSFMHRRASLVAKMVRNLPATQETWVWSLGWEDPLVEGMATNSSILAWKVPWTEESDGSMESQRVRQDWVAKHTYTHTHIHTHRNNQIMLFFNHFNSLEVSQNLMEQESKSFFNPTHHGLSAFSFCLFMLGKLLFQSSCPWKAHQLLGSIIQWWKTWIQKPKYQSPNICFVLISD